MNKRISKKRRDKTMVVLVPVRVEVTGKRKRSHE